jgi:hypothetical protein
MQVRRLAILELGGIEQAREKVGTYRHDEVGRDARYAVRRFLRNPVSHPSRLARRVLKK